MKDGRNDMIKIDLVFALYDILNSGKYFTVSMIENRFHCSRSTTLRAVQYLREKRQMQICYDKTLGVYRLGEYNPITYKEAYKRRMARNGEEEKLKKKLYNIYGRDWKNHYEEGKTND